VCATITDSTITPMASERAARPRAPPFIDPPGYVRHRSEETLLYQVVERHYRRRIPSSGTNGRDGTTDIVLGAARFPLARLAALVPAAGAFDALSRGLRPARPEQSEHRF
jgi:hypothetical protein